MIFYLILWFGSFKVKVLVFIQLSLSSKHYKSGWPSIYVLQSLWVPIFQLGFCFCTQLFVHKVQRRPCTLAFCFAAFKTHVAVGVCDPEKSDHMPRMTDFTLGNLARLILYIFRFGMMCGFYWCIKKRDWKGFQCLTVRLEIFMRLL